MPALSGIGRVAYMHQLDLLLPWRNVLSNAVLGLEIAEFRARRRNQRRRSWRLASGSPIFSMPIPQRYPVA